MALTNKLKYFPTTFAWGVATAAYQIEGAATIDGRGSSIWDEFSHTPGKVLSGDTGDIACDHYHRYPEDIALMNHIGVTHYRFSVSWPRILPDGDSHHINAKGLAFYDRLVDTLLDNQIIPAITLYHWDLPSELQIQGGWLNSRTSDVFAEYAQIMVAVLGDRVKQWITHNEPWCTAVLGHLTGEHAPGVTSKDAALTAAHHVLLSHGKAMMAMRSTRNDLQIGITLNLSQVYPDQPSVESIRAASLQDVFNNRWYLDPLFVGHYPEELIDIFGKQPQFLSHDMDLIKQPLDFLGVNYYSAQVVAPSGDNESPWPVRHVTPKDRITAMGWPVIPKGLTDLLMRLQRDYGPIPLFITENGAAYPDEIVDGRIHDVDRIEYLSDHIEAIADALAHGVDVRGYFLWSLLDNFEWAFGYSKRFGIVYVDYTTLERTLKDSALWYGRLIHDALSLPLNPV